jgi:XTP/dITP diphosphohydrolase
LDILIATSNPGKFKEISAFLQLTGLKLLSLRDFPKVEAPEETGESFEENALIKAKYFAEKFGVTTISDDGGLEIEVLNGEPGIKSRRWINGVTESTDDELAEYCLEKLKGEKNRKAKLTACLCLYIYINPNDVGVHKYEPHGAHNYVPLQKNVTFVQESISGIITEKPSPSKFPGFPFRRLLWIPEIKKFYNEDELSESETKKYNHRYRAVAKLKCVLDKYI